MKALFRIRKHSYDIDVVLLIIRIVVGAAFVIHGSAKIPHAFGWMGPQAHIPGFFQALAALSEFGGGFALILGLLTRLGAFGITCTMAVAIAMHSMVMGDPFVNLAGGRSFELAASYLLTAILLLVAGPGRFSLDRLFFGAKA